MAVASCSPLTLSSSQVIKLIKGCGCFLSMGTAGEQLAGVPLVPPPSLGHGGPGWAAVLRVPHSTHGKVDSTGIWELERGSDLGTRIHGLSRATGGIHPQNTPFAFVVTRGLETHCARPPGAERVAGFAPGVPGTANQRRRGRGSTSSRPCRWRGSAPKMRFSRPRGSGLGTPRWHR